MSLLHSDKLRARAQRRVTSYADSAGGVLRKSVAAAADQEFDIFLSHSALDAEEVLGLKLTLEDHGHSVYVDWVNDRELDRSSVSRETARILRARMQSSRCLLYVTSSNAASSKWTPWELGFKDGSNGRAAVLPITLSQTERDEVA